MGIRKKIDNILGKLLILILILIVLNILWQIITRFLLHNPSTFTDEIARYLMIWLCVLGIAFISGRKMHIDIDLLPKKLNGQMQKKIKKIINIFIIIICFYVFIIAGSKLVYSNFVLNHKSSTLQIPLPLIYLIIPISGIIIIYYKVSDLRNR